MRSDRLRRRTNLVGRRAEAWRPPLLVSRPGGLARAASAVRRYFDLQAGSVWDDLAAELPSVRGTVLDVGCGGQPYRGLLDPGVRYIGLDTADAKARFGYEMPDTRCFDGDAWPVEAASADVVLCTETLEHVPEPRLFLAEAARCVRPGGRLILTVPFAARWHFVPHDYWRFTPSGLGRLLAEAGFGEVEVYARGNRLTVACHKAMALILPLVMPQGRGAAAAWAMRLLGLPLLPLLVALAVVGNLSLRGRGGDDCLGYTVLAVRADGSDR